MQNSVCPLFSTGSSRTLHRHRGTRLIVIADSDYYSILGVSRNASKSEIKSDFADKYWKDTILVPSSWVSFSGVYFLWFTFVALRTNTKVFVSKIVLVTLIC